MSQLPANAITTMGDLVSPERTQEGKNICHLASIRWQPLPMVNPEGTDYVKTRDTGPRWLSWTLKEHFSESRL